METQDAHSDRISNLPIEVLTRIISTLPTSSAVETSILSRQWRYVFTGIHTLSLSGVAERLNNDADRTSFRRFLDTLVSPGATHFLQQVEFPLSEEIDCVHASQWISLLMEGGIRKLELSNTLTNNPMFSLSLSTSKTLVELVLSGNISVSFPESLDFPCVKVVSMDGILLDNTPTCVRNLLSGCPALEELVITDCKYSGGSIQVHSPSLKILVMSCLAWSEKDVIEIDAPNLLHLFADATCSFDINAPNLGELYVSDLCWLGNDFKIKYMPTLEDATLQFDVSNRVVMKTLYRAREARTLKLVLKLRDYTVKNLPVLLNLKSLEVKMSSWPFIVGLLGCSPHLESFVASFDDIDAAQWSTPPSVPGCVTYLRVFKVAFYNGDAFMDQLIQYIFSNATSLTEMIIEVCRDSEHLIGQLNIDLERMAFENQSNCDIRVGTSPTLQLEL